MGLKKGDYNSINFINNFLLKIHEDGTYDCIHAKGFKITKWLSPWNKASDRVGGNRQQASSYRNSVEHPNCVHPKSIVGTGLLAMAAALATQNSQLAGVSPGKW